VGHAATLLGNAPTVSQVGSTDGTVNAARSN
jgi:hypothetical protein